MDTPYAPHPTRPSRCARARVETAGPPQRAAGVLPLILLGLLCLTATACGPAPATVRPGATPATAAGPTAARSTAAPPPVPTPQPVPPRTDRPAVTPDFASPFGISEGVGGIPALAQERYDPRRYAEDTAHDAGLLAALGAGWYRIHTTQYGSLEYGRLEKDGYSFQQQDELIRSLQAEGVALVIMLGPRPGNERPCGEPYLPMGEAAFTDYVRRVVERYDGDGLDDMPGLRYGVHHWQLDNEVDLHWQGCQNEGGLFSTPEEYVAALRVTRAAIRAADPQGSLFPSFWYAGDAEGPGAAYFAEFLRLGGAGYVDGIDTHDYNLNRERLLYRLNHLNELLSADPKPIWVMETSVPSDAEANPSWNETRHARAVVQWHVTALSVPHVEKVFWFSLAQSPSSWESQQWKLFGTNGLYDCQPPYPTDDLGITVCGDLVLGPGGHTYQLLVDKLAGFIQAEALAEGIYRFRFAGGRAVLVLWSAAGADVVDLEPYGMSGQVRVTHIVEQPGQAQARVEIAPAQAVPVDESPIFVELAP